MYQINLKVPRTNFVFKCASLTCVNNYWPISLFCMCLINVREVNVCKINRIIVAKKKNLFENQFRSGHLTM